MENTRRHTIPAHVAGMLRHARHARGWSLRRAGREAGVSASMLVHLEAARRAPSTTVAAAIIRAYGLPPGDATALMDAAVGGAGRDYTPWGTPTSRWDVVHGAAPGLHRIRRTRTPLPLM
jgi:DNA-binding XRE family transcriptional regulator